MTPKTRELPIVTHIVTTAGCLLCNDQTVTAADIGKDCPNALRMSRAGLPFTDAEVCAVVNEPRLRVLGLLDR